MKTRHLFLLAILFFAAGRTAAQDTYEVLDWKSHVSWHKYLLQKMHEQYRERDRRVQEALGSKKQTEAYRERVQQRYQSIQGSFPPLTPLNAKVKGTIEREGYRIEKVVYESFGNHHVTANLYVPEGKGKWPAALFLCGHERQAKATESYQKTAILLARNGFVVLVVDPISQAERFQLTDGSGKPLTRGGTTAHTLLNEGSNLVGTNIVNYEYWDNKRGLDYLMARPEVDTSRVGVLGNSGGGTMTTYFLALNNKVKVAAPCSYVARRERAIEVLGPQDGCQWVPFEGRERLEIDDFLMLKQTIPTIILAGKYDFVDYVGVKRTYREMKQFYSVLGRPDEIKLFSWSDGHGISKPKREAAVQWFRRWFYDDSSRVEEGDLSTLTEQQLQVTRSGQVNADYPNEYNIQQRNLDLAEELKTLLGFEDNPKAVEPEWVGSVEDAGLEWKKVILRKEGTLPVPALVYVPSGHKKSNGTELWLPREGKTSLLKNDTFMKHARESGRAIILADVRGTGETRDPEEFNASKYYDSQYRNDQISLHIGKPVVGQRVQDIETVMDFISQYEKLQDEDVEVHASGFVGSPALHAAVMDQRIGRLMLNNTIRSYMDMLRNPTMKEGYAYVVPNALKYYDLPDLVERVGREAVTYQTEGGMYSK